jgi:hypothetical protein
MYRKEALGDNQSIVSSQHFGKESLKNPFRKEMKKMNGRGKRFVNIEELDKMFNMSVNLRDEE